MTTSLPQDTLALLKRLGVSDAAYAQAGLSARSPITGETVGTLRETTPAEADAAIGRARAVVWPAAAAMWRSTAVRLAARPPRAVACSAVVTRLSDGGASAAAFPERSPT